MHNGRDGKSVPRGEKKKSAIVGCFFGFLIGDGVFNERQAFKKETL